MKIEVNPPPSSFLQGLKCRVDEIRSLLGVKCLQTDFLRLTFTIAWMEKFCKISSN